MTFRYHTDMQVWTPHRVTAKSKQIGTSPTGKIELSLTYCPPPTHYESFHIYLAVILLCILEIGIEK
jgi:hypothetical protein